MSGYAPKDVTYTPTNSFSGVVTNKTITKADGFPITAEGSRNFVAKITASSTAIVGTVTAKLQTAIGSDWVDSKTVVITADGNFYIKLNVEVTADQTFLPLLSAGRIVITSTNAGDAGTFAVNILQQL